MIGKKELTGVVITVIVVKMLLVYPRELVMNAGQAAWIQVLYVSIAALLLIFITMRIYSYKRSVVELADMVGGKWLRVVTGTVIFLILLANFSGISRIFPETVKIVLLQDINTEIITAFYAAAAGIGAYMGIKSLARVNYMFLPIAGVVFAGFVLLLIPYYRIENIMPVFGEGPKRIFLSGFNSLSLFSDIIVLNVLVSYSKNLSEAKTVAFRATAISAAASVLITAAYCLSHSYPTSQDYIMPVYQMARIIHISSFFSRFEAFFQFVWSILVFFYSSIYVFAMCSVIQSTFNLKFFKPLILPVIIAGLTIAGIPSAVTDAIDMEKYINLVEYPIVFLLPIILGAAANGKKRREA